VTEWRAAGTETIAIASDASSTDALMPARRTIARFEATATVAIPDSFTDAVSVWTRAGGTSTLPARLETARTSWSEVASHGARSATLRGYLYRALHAEPDSSEAWLPVPPDRARLAFTVMGKTRRPFAAEPAAPKSFAIRATPNPFRGEIALAGRPHATAGIFDLAGRRVRGLVLDGSGHARWDGRRDDGRPTGAGLYFLRPPGAPAVRIVRLP
jgi:hypothetical protein